MLRRYRPAETRVHAMRDRAYVEDRMLRGIPAAGAGDGFHDVLCGGMQRLAIILLRRQVDRLTHCQCDDGPTQPAQAGIDLFICVPVTR